MKNLIITMIITFTLSMSVKVFAQSSKSVDEFTVQVDGLGCPFCAYGLEKKFKDFKGIKKVKIDMETGLFTFIYPAEKKLTIDKIIKQVEVAGYTPMSVKIYRADGTIEDTTSDTKVIAEDDSEVGKKAAIYVAGNCEMCKARIEKAAFDTEGVISSIWNKESKLLAVQFDEAKTSKQKIEKSIAKAGHDTKTMKADKNVYENLPACCYYERVPQN